MGGDGRGLVPFDGTAEDASDTETQDALTQRESSLGPRPFPRMRNNLKKGEEEREGKGLANRVGLARQMECERGRISRDNETTSDR